MSQVPLATEEMISRQSPEAQAIIRLLLARIAEQDRRISALEADVAALKKTPRNSSLPPSTEHPHAKPPRDEKRSKRKPGGQPGHPKHERSLIPAEQCHAVFPLQPETCRRCGEALAGSDPEPLRHQVWEIPPIVPLVTEYQLHRLSCPCCRESTCAQLPVDVPSSQGGPRLVALALLMGCFQQSKRRVALLLESVLNQPCSPGWVVKLQQQATAAITPPCEELAQQLPAEDVLGIDESPTKQGGTSKAWLWTCRCQLYRVCPANDAGRDGAARAPDRRFRWRDQL